MSFTATAPPRRPSGGRPTPSSTSASAIPHQAHREFAIPAIPTRSTQPRVMPHHHMQHRPSYPSPKSTLPRDSSLTESTRVNQINQTSRRQSPIVLSPKEAELETPKQTYTAQVAVRDDIDAHLEQLFNTLQVPDSVRQKFSTVSPDVKSSILNSSTNIHLTTPKGTGVPSTPEKERPNLRKRLSQPLLRKARSSSSLGSPGTSPQIGRTYRVDGDHFTIVASPTIPAPHPHPHPTRGQSMDVPRPATVRTGSNRPMSSLFTGKPKGLGIAIGEQPESFIQWLSLHKATDLGMEVDRMKKLRMLLRHEKTEWVGKFIDHGGYKLVLARLQDLLDIEWREEQHDDQMLYELLRCIKALSTSEIGKHALRSSFPSPFSGLSSLLFSEKKPGDLPSRQLIIELWLFLFDLFPPCTSLSPPTSRPTPTRPSSVRFEPGQVISKEMFKTSSPSGPSHSMDIDVVNEIRKLVIPDLPNKAAEQHDFVTRAHRPRVFRAWVQELSDICRDYFWIMCHANNVLWAEHEVDEEMVHKPVAPGGATGGVEFEAMNYVVMHFRLLNALCHYTAQQDRNAAVEMHRDLLMSGMDRILVTMRKASTTFYPSLHLELARYVTHLQLASPNARLPHLIDKLVGSPPEGFRKRSAYGTAEVDWFSPQSHAASPRQGQDYRRPRPVSTGPMSGWERGGEDRGAGVKVHNQPQRQAQGQIPQQHQQQALRALGHVEADGGRRGGVDMQLYQASNRGQRLPQAQPQGQVRGQVQGQGQGQGQGFGRPVEAR